MNHTLLAKLSVLAKSIKMVDALSISAVSDNMFTIKMVTSYSNQNIRLLEQRSKTKIPSKAKHSTLSLRKNIEVRLTNIHILKLAPNQLHNQFLFISILEITSHIPNITSLRHY